MAKTLILTRDVTVDECPWLDRDLKAGDVLWSYDAYTYGCVSPGGIAVTAKAAETPFFEVPADAVK